MGTPRGASDDARLDTTIQALPPHGNESNKEHEGAKKSHHELNLNSISTDKKNQVVLEKAKVISTASELPAMQLTNVTGVSDISSAAMTVNPQTDTNRAADAFKSLLNAVIKPSALLVAAAGDPIQQGALPDVSAIQTTTFTPQVFASQSSGVDHKDNDALKKADPIYTPSAALLADAASTATPKITALSQSATRAGERVNVNEPLTQVALPQVSAKAASTFASTAQIAATEVKDASANKQEGVFSPASSLLADAASTAMPKATVEVHDAFPSKLSPIQVAASLSQTATVAGDKTIVTEPMSQVALPQLSARAAFVFASTTPDVVAEPKDLGLRKQETNFTPASVLLADAAPKIVPKVTAEAHDVLITAPAPIQFATGLSQTAVVATDKTNVADSAPQVALPVVSARTASVFASETIYAPASILVADAAPLTVPKAIVEVRDALPALSPTVQVATLLSQSATGTVDKTNFAAPTPQVALPQVSARTASTISSTPQDLTADIKNAVIKKQETIYTPAAVLLADAVPPSVQKVSTEVHDVLPVTNPAVQVANLLPQAVNGTGDKPNIIDQAPQVVLPTVSARAASAFASTNQDSVAELNATIKKQENIYTPASVLIADAAPPAVPKISTEVHDLLPATNPPVQVASLLSQAANGTSDRTHVTDTAPQVALPQVPARAASAFASTTQDSVTNLKDANFKKLEPTYSPSPILVADSTPLALPKVAAEARDALPVANAPVQVASLLAQAANGTVDKTNAADQAPQVALPQVSARTASTFASTTQDSGAEINASIKKQENIYTPASVLLADGAPPAVPKVTTEVHDVLPAVNPRVQVASLLSQAANGTSDRTNFTETAPQVALPTISARAASAFASTTQESVAGVKDANFKKPEPTYAPSPILVADATPVALPKVAGEVRDALPVANPPVQVASLLSQVANGTSDKTNFTDTAPQVALPTISARAASTFASTIQDSVADLKDANFKKPEPTYAPSAILVADAAPAALPKVAIETRDALPAANPPVQVASLLAQAANGTGDKTNVADPVPQVALPQVTARAASTFASTTPDSVADLNYASLKKTDTNYAPATILVADAAPSALPKVATEVRDALPAANPPAQIASLLSQANNGTGDRNNVGDPVAQVALPQGSARTVSNFASAAQDTAPPIVPPIASPVAPLAPAAILVADATRAHANTADQLNQNKNISNAVDASQFNGRYVGPGTTSVVAEQSTQPTISARPFASGLARDAAEPNALLTADSSNNGRQFFALPGSSAQVKSVIADGATSGITAPLTKLIDTTSGASAAESFKQLIGRQVQGEPTVATLAADALKLVIARQLGNDLSADASMKTLINPNDKSVTPNQILVGANQILVNGASIDNRLSDPRLITDLGPNSARSPLTISGPLDSLNPAATTKGITLTASTETTLTGSLVSTGIKTGAGTAADAHIAQSINIMVGIGTGVTIGADGKPITTTDGKTSLIDPRVPTSLIPLPSDITSTIKSGDTTTATALTGKEIKLADLTDLTGTKKGETKAGDTAAGTGEPSARMTFKAGDKKDPKEEDAEVLKNVGTMAGAGGFGGGSANPANDPNNAQTSSTTATGTVIDPDQKMTLPNLEIVDGRVLIAGQKNIDNDGVNSGNGINASTRGEIETGIASDGPHSRQDDVSGITKTPASNNPTEDSKISEIERLFGINKTQPNDEEVAWQAGQRQTELLSFERRRPYKIKRGDSLADIARRELGNVAYLQLLIELNIDTLTFDRNGQIILTPGRDIYLPSRADMLRFMAYQEQESKLLLAFVDRKNIDINQQVVYACRLGDTLFSVAKRHPAVKDARLWKLVAELNDLSTKKDKNGAPVARLERGQHLLLPTAEQKSDYLHELAFGTKSKDLSHDFVRHIAEDKVSETVLKTTLKDKAMTVEPDISFKSRLVSQSDLGDTGDSLVLRLELRIEGKFVPVVEYSIGFGSATLRVHTKNGENKVTNIDLPNRSARELAESDLAANSNMYCQNFENNVLPL